MTKPGHRPVRRPLGTPYGPVAGPMGGLAFACVYAATATFRGAVSRVVRTTRSVRTALAMT